MNINSIDDKIYSIETINKNQTQRQESGIFTLGSRNMGPDTVSISDEAIAKYQAMQVSTEPSTFDPNSVNDKAISGKMDDGEFLAFLQSDNFAKDAMAYVKGVAVENKGMEDDDDPLNQVAKNLGGGDASSDVASSNAVLSGASTEGQESGTGGFASGSEKSREELAAAIVKARQELEDLTTAYEEIMSGTGEMEEKIQLSEPVHEQLERKADELQNLEAQAKMQDMRAKGMLETV